jgi:hypothetical protein
MSATLRNQAPTVKNVSRPQPQSSGPVVDHVKVGRRFLPQLVATGVVHAADWVRDDLPDLLWPVLVLSLRGTDAARDFVRWQGAVQGDLRDVVDAQALADGLDGRLTSLDGLQDRHAGAREVVVRRAEEHHLLPPEVGAVLAGYLERPAGWLVDREFASHDQADAEFLAKALLEVLKDGHREAVIKCLFVWSAVQAGTFSSSPDTIDLLKVYPNDLSMLSKTDSVVRACWAAHKGALLAKDEHRYDDSIRWAKIFWGVNSMTTGCVRKRDIEDAAATDDEADAAPKADGEPSPGGDHLQQLAMDLVSSYVEALERAPARLYDQERQEVHAGLVSRAGREVITALGYKDLWCVEHGSHVIRALVEVRILLQWMASQDPAIYRTYQEFGAGKAKLYARIVDELPDEARIAGFDEAIEELERLSHNDGVLDLRVIDTSDSFSGKSIRVMAQECGLLELYRHAYYIASGVSHSEWWSVETHAMERCLNVLHRGHLIPSLSLSVGANVPLAQSWVDQLYALIRISLQILRTDEAVVTDAFAWLEDASED